MLNSSFSATSALNVIMMTPSNWNILRIAGSLCGQFIGHRWIPLTKASDAELWGFLDLRLNKRNKQSRRRWFDAPSRSLWYKHIHYNALESLFGSHALIVQKHTLSHLHMVCRDTQIYSLWAMPVQDWLMPCYQLFVGHNMAGIIRCQTALATGKNHSEPHYTHFGISVF